MSVYTVKTGEFEGPLELLLRLIEEKKLHISRVSLATVADQFLAHLQTLGEMNKALAANFIYIASTLMLIKSASLLPDLHISAEEEKSIQELEERLKLYQRMKELSRGISRSFGKKIIFLREEPTVLPVFAPTAEIRLDGLAKTLKQIIASLPQIEILPKVVVNKIRKLEEVIAELTERIQNAMQLSFRDVVKNQKEKVSVILNFLGLLELIKRGAVGVKQEELFSDITLYNSPEKL